MDETEPNDGEGDNNSIISGRKMEDKDDMKTVLNTVADLTTKFDDLYRDLKPIQNLLESMAKTGSESVSSHLLTQVIKV